MFATKSFQFLRSSLFLVLNLCLQITLIYCIGALFLALPFWPQFFFAVTDPLRFLGFYSSILVALDLVWKGTQPLPLYSPLEAAHLLDVHRLIFKTFLFLPVCAILIRWSSSQMPSPRIPHQIWKWTFLGWCVLSVFILLGFPIFFELFHRVFFPQGNWAFDPNSRLIQTFPLPFWIISFVVLQIWVLTWLFWKSRRAADPKF
jgi:hypothetical protein